MAPLVLSVRRSATASIEGSSGVGKGSCRFCGSRAKSQEPSSFLDTDGACPYCQLVWRLDHPSIDNEAVLIWLPEFTQAALIAIVRECHSRLSCCGIQQLNGPDAAPAASATTSTRAREALAAIATFQSRIAEAEARLGSSSPRVLGQALLRLNAEAYADRARRLNGVRLMPLLVRR